MDAADRCRDAIETLRDGDVVLGSGEVDYAVADMLEVLVAMHDQTGINLNVLPQVDAVARLIVEGWSL